MGVLRNSCPAWLALGISLSLQACSAAGQNGAPEEGKGAAAPTGTAGSGSSHVPAQGGSMGGPDLGSIDTMAGSASGPPGEQCATAQAEATLTKEPVDIILVLDNSGSMAQELQAVEDNINKNFASILATGDADYRVILIDTPPSLGLLTLNALVAADSVLVPLQCEYLAIEGLAKITQTIEMVKA